MMPLSEFHSSLKGKHEPTQSKMANCYSDLSSFVPDQEFVELLWENGQIVMQGQSNRPKKTSSPGAFPSYAVQEKERRDAVAPKASRYGSIDSAGKEFQTTGPLGQIGLNGQDVDMVPWPNYPFDDYCTEFLPELSGVNLNSSPTTVPADRTSSYNQATKGVLVTESGTGTGDSGGCSEPSGMMNSPLLQLPQQCQSFIPRSRAKEVDFTTGTMYQGPTGDLHTAKMQKQDLTSSKLMQPTDNMGLANFSHFSRPVALAKANLQSFDRVRSEKAPTTAASNPIESTLIEPTSGFKSISGFHGQLTPVTAKPGSQSSAQPLKEIVSVEHSDAICQEDADENSRNYNKIDTMNNQRSPSRMKPYSSSLTDSVAVVKCKAHKRPEPIVASPSMCSANGASPASNVAKNRGKRKSLEGDESEYQSEQDLEDDSFDVKRPIPGRGTGIKRSRAAEVHNLSERRRRDKINEKMRALQELIPNCNKVDKASVLDEAIEYLKSLQMQVQIMSMGSGLCMPPVILPAGVRAAHMGPYGPMGLGMGMGMGLGFGMGMLDMTGSPLIPVPPMHGPQYPCPAIPGAAGLHLMPVSNNLHIFGMPGQASPMPMPRPPLFTPVPEMSVKVNPLAEIPRAEVCQVQVTDSAPQSSKDQQLKTLDPVAKTSTDNSQATKGCIKQSAAVDIDHQTSAVCGGEALNSGDTVSSSARASDKR